MKKIIEMIPSRFSLIPTGRDLAINKGGSKINISPLILRGNTRGINDCVSMCLSPSKISKGGSKNEISPLLVRGNITLFQHLLRRFISRKMAPSIPKHIVLSLMLLFSLVSCYQMPTKEKEIDCPLPPSQLCIPQKWNGVALDTSSQSRVNSDHWYVFERVAQLNSPADEWSLSFIDDHLAIMTFSDDDFQRMVLVRVLRENKARVISGLSLPIIGSFGGAAVNNNKVIFAAKEKRIIPRDQMYDGSENMVDLRKGYVATSDLYEAILDGDLLNAVNQTGASLHFSDFSWESHPSLSADGSVLFFSSDRPNNNKGTDIWFSIRKSYDSWSEPINCGDNINSDCDELTPFISKNGKELYFSSSGHETVGGYDIFVSKVSEKFWQLIRSNDMDGLNNSDDLFSEAENLRPPLNTPSDEIFPSSPDDCDSLLYYSSDQDKEESMISMKGGFDIYVRRKVVPAKRDEQIAAQNNIDIKLEVEEPKNLIVLEDPEIAITRFFKMQGYIRDLETKQPIANADISIKQIDTVSNTAEETMQMKTASSGEYKVWLKKGEQYEITAQHNEYFYDTQRIKIREGDTTTLINTDFYLPQMFQLRINFPTDVYDYPYRFVLDSNGVETDQTWQDAIKKLADNIIKYQSQIVKVQLVGHTDDVGTVGYNNTLGKNRVNFVIDRLVENGVPRKLLEGRSAGELEPLIRKESEEIEDHRKRLRRVTLQKVLKEK
jgi:outer membrane protein OmpA-like peptidoglycan-associated protein